MSKLFKALERTERGRARQHTEQAEALTPEATATSSGSTSEWIRDNSCQRAIRGIELTAIAPTPERVADAMLNLTNHRDPRADRSLDAALLLVGPRNAVGRSPRAALARH